MVNPSIQITEDEGSNIQIPRNQGPSPNRRNSFTSPTIQPWRKLLYIKQQYPDNYTDSSFLSQLKRNSTVQKYSYWKLVQDFSLISMHLTCLSIVHIVFFGMYNYHWNPIIPTSAATLVSIICFMIYNNLSPKLDFKLNYIKSSVLIFFSILTLSPVLKSLSESTSSDSIWTLSVWLCICNLLFTDYHFDINEKFKPVLSMNILVANAIVLASRLETTGSVFCFILFAFEMHGMFPFFDIWLRKYFIKAHYSLLFILSFIVYWFIWDMGGFFTLIIWISLNFFVVMVCPIYFLELQKYKNEVQGPWDPAKPVI